MSHRERTRAAYDVVAHSYAAELPDTGAEADLDLAMISLFVARLTGPAVLDAGCGTGRMATHLLTPDASLIVTGVDQSSAMLEQARAALPDTALVEADLAALPFEDAAFDGIQAWYSIIHAPIDEKHSQAFLMAVAPNTA